MSNTALDVEPPSDLSLALIHLFKGPLYRDSHEKLWHQMLRVRAAVSDHVAVLGLQLEVDETEGYAYLRSRPTVEDADDALPRLVARRSLSFPVSLLLALLRKRLAELDAAGTDTRLVLTRDQIVEMLRVFLPESSNEAKLVDSIDAHIAKVIDLGFLRRMRGEDDLFEVRRILKAYVDGQWLGELDRRLAEYLAELDPQVEAGGAPEGGEP